LLQWLNLAPSSLQPVQFIISGVRPCALCSKFHFSAVFARNSSSLDMVAILASQEAQFNPQQAISYSIFITDIFCFVTNLAYSGDNPMSASELFYFQIAAQLSIPLAALYHFMVIVIIK
jgi:hypothetical protein